MADRTVVVKLKAEVQDYKTALKDAGTATAKVGVEAEAASKKTTTALGAMSDASKKHSEAWGTVSTGMLGAGVAIGAGIGLAVSKFSEFDAAMSQAQAGTTATGAALGDLRAAAIAGGAATQFSATEAANAITEMGKAGVSTKDILGGGLTGALSLAAAGQLSVGRAGEIAATAMNQFGLAGKDLPHVADLMAAGAGKAMGSVDDLAQALKYVGPVAKNLNVSIEQTTGVIAELASQGIIGEQAGTSMRGMLLSLTSPSKIAAKEMENLGINMYDANGKFIGLAGAAGQLQQKMGGLDDATRNEAMGRIFGNEQITAATVLYQGGSKAVNEWTQKVDDSGFAAKQAAALTDNLKGDVERLGGSLDTALIQTGSGANEALRGLAQNAEGVINILGGMDPTATKVILGITGVIGVASLLAGGFMVLAPKIAATKVALDALSTSHKTTANVIKGVGVAAGLAAGALAIGVIGLSIWAAHAAEAEAKTEALAKTLDQTTGALTDMTREAIKADLAAKSKFLWFDNGGSAYDNAQKLGIGLDLVTEAASGSADAMNKVNEVIKAGAAGTDGYSAALAKSGLSAEDFNDASRGLSNSLKGSNATLDDAVRVTRQKADADTKGATDAGAQKTAMDFVTKAADKQVVSLKDLLKIQSDLAGINMSAGESEAAWAQQVMDNGEALKKLSGYVDENGKKVKGLGSATKDGGATLDLYSKAGQLASDSLLGTSKSAWTMINAAEKGGATTEQLRQKTTDARTEFIHQATQMGLTGAAAGALADSYGLIPGKIQTTAELNKAQAEADLDALAAKVKALPNGVVSIETVGAAGVYSYLQSVQNAINTINNTHIKIANGPGGQGGTTFAEGGYTGDGAKYEAAGIVHKGEYVITAAKTRQIGVANLNAVYGGYANGGYVGGGSPVSSASESRNVNNQFDITVQSDPVGTAMAVARRLSMAGAV